MSERMHFVVRLESGERMSDLCREFGVSRTTGYKLWSRYRELGAEAIQDLSRKPRRSPLQTPDEILQLIYERRRARPTWGPGKLKSELELLYPGVQFPGTTVIGKWLKREGFVKGRKKRRRASPTPVAELSQSEGPNDIWSADYKGQFRLGNRRYCYPLTISDHFSRYLFACEGMEAVSGRESKVVFREVFRMHGLPKKIRTDNGAPFASTGLGGLTKLSVWWMRLGIELERIKPGHPEQNGRHERMHLTLKQDTTRPAASNHLTQQQRFDDYLDEYNAERPHEALDMKRPAEVYESSPRPYPEKLDDLEYPLHDDSRRVKKGGNIHLWNRNRTCYISLSLVGERVGLRQIEAHKWLVTFMNRDLGQIDSRTEKLERF